MSKAQRKKETMAKGLRTPKGPASPPYSLGPYEWSQAIVLNKPVIEGSNRYVLTEEFNKCPAANAVVNAPFTDADATAAANGVITVASNAANKDFEVTGTNITTTLVTFGVAVGAICVTTAGGDNDQGIIHPHLDTKQTAWTGIPWGTENQTQWETVIKTDSAILTTLLWAGLKKTSTPVIATDTDQAFFRFSTDDGDTNWKIISSIGGVDINADSGVAVKASTIYYFRIEIDSSRQAHFFINNKEVYRTEALTNDVDLIPYVGVQALAAAARSVWIAKEKISRYIYE